MKLFKQSKKEDYLVVYVGDSLCRAHHLKPQDGSISQLGFTQFNYENILDLTQQFESWCKNQSVKGLLCRWVLSRDLYQTLQITPPKVTEKELQDAIKWQVKDLIEFPLNEVLVSHYQPKQVESQTSQITAVVVKKQLVETLIESANKIGLEMDSIEIEELSLGHALLDHLDSNKIKGFIGEDSTGLTFSFFNGSELAFSRYKKGYFLPSQAAEEFTLEGENNEQEDAFLLETQRTLDYVVSQVFRRPVEQILLQQTSGNSSKLAQLVKQITEIEVALVKPQITQQYQEFEPPSLVEIGCALRQDGQ